MSRHEIAASAPGWRYDEARGLFVHDAEGLTRPGTAQRRDLNLAVAEVNRDRLIEQRKAEKAEWHRQHPGALARHQSRQQRAREAEARERGDGRR